MFLAQRSWILLACSHSSGVNMIFLHTLRLRLSRQPIRKHLPAGAGTVHSISRASGPEVSPTMGSGSPGKPLHACGASMCGHTCVACYPRIRSRDRGWFRTMRPWDSLRDDHAHCSAPYVISFSGNDLLHIHHPSEKRRPVWTLDKLLVQTAIGAPQIFLRSPDCRSAVPVSSFRFGPWDGRFLTFRRSDRSIGGTVR